jgi:selenide,water dikinase
VIVPDTTLGALIFDPQTAGGLLAAVPENEVAATLTALRAQGYDAARIGRLRTAPGLVFA